MHTVASSRTDGVLAAAVASGCLVSAAGLQFLGSQPLALLLVGLAGVNGMLAADRLVWHGSRRRVTTPLLLLLVGLVGGAATWLTVSQTR